MRCRSALERPPTIRVASVNLLQVMREATEEIRHQVLARRQNLTVQMPTRAVFVAGDSLRLERIVTNLLENSSKYTPPDGHLALSLAIERDYAVLRIRDLRPHLATPAGTSMPQACHRWMT
jgi:signal transduction histidine kinase